MNVEQISQMKNGEIGRAVLAVADVEIRQTKKQTNFLSLTLVDKTGAIKAKIWDWDVEAPEVGSIWDINFEYSPYQDSPQIVVRAYTTVDKKNVDAGNFIESISQEEFKFYKNELEALIKSIKDKDLAKFIHNTVFKIFPQFLSCVGAKVNHHGRLGGLIQHSVRVTRNAEALANAYKNTPTYKFIDMDLLLAGGIIHDLGKVGEYTTEPMVIDHTLEGVLSTHYGTGPAYLMESYIKQGEPISRNRLLGLFHIMVTHHGTDRSIKPPSTITAWLVHAADIADCFTDLIEHHIEEDKPISSSKNWALGNKVVDERYLK